MCTNKHQLFPTKKENKQAKPKHAKPNVASLGLDLKDIQAEPKFGQNEPKDSLNPLSSFEALTSSKIYPYPNFENIPFFQQIPPSILLWCYHG